MKNRGIGRARMFMGALLLIAAAMTWGIGLTMSPHGKAVANGTDYFRSTVLTYRLNGAIGTLVLCGLAAWLLFPRRWPKRPVRDWSLLGLLALLAGSSVYTLIWLLPIAHKSNATENAAASDPGSEGTITNVDENLAMMNQPMSAGITAVENGANLNAAPASQFERLKARAGGNAAAAERNERAIRGEQSAEPALIDEQSGAQRKAGVQDVGNEPTNSDPDGNQD